MTSNDEPIGDNIGLTLERLKCVPEREPNQTLRSVSREYCRLNEISTHLLQSVLQSWKGCKETKSIRQQPLNIRTTHRGRSESASSMHIVYYIHAHTSTMSTPKQGSHLIISAYTTDRCHTNSLSKPSKVDKTRPEVLKSPSHNLLILLTLILKAPRHRRLLPGLIILIHRRKGQHRR